MSEPALASAAQHYRDAFEQLRPGLRGSPARREAAMARFTELGFPGAREEAWKYTSLRRLETRRFAPAAANDLLRDTELPRGFATHRVVIENGRWRQDLSTAGAAQAAGFRISTLQTTGVDEAFSAAVLRVQAGGGTERFSALNAALSIDPILLECDTSSDEFLQVSLIAAGETASVTSPRLVVRMAPGSRGRLLLDYFDDGLVERFVNSVLDVELGDGAELQVYRLQRQGDRAFHIDRVDANVGSNARFVMRDSQLGSSLARLDLNVDLSGRAAQTELTGVFLADGSRHLDTHALVHHRAVETVSLQDYRGIAANRGRGVFTGKAIVHPGAQKSNARQSSRNLLLTPGAEIDTKPELEIYADDVQCSHGATTGQLDPAALFYLRSRGLSEPEARSALTRAFAGAVLSQVDVASLAAHVQHELDRRLVRLLEVTE
jgi:Fe-S cluster assembly protein SufD